MLHGGRQLFLIPQPASFSDLLRPPPAADRRMVLPDPPRASRPEYVVVFAWMGFPATIHLASFQNQLISHLLCTSSLFLHAEYDLQLFSFWSTNTALQLGINFGAQKPVINVRKQNKF
jgi:hypothetical protein